MWVWCLFCVTDRWSCWPQPPAGPPALDSPCYTPQPLHRPHTGDPTAFYLNCEGDWSTKANQRAGAYSNNSSKSSFVTLVALKEWILMQFILFIYFVSSEVVVGAFKRNWGILCPLKSFQIYLLKLRFNRLTWTRDITLCVYRTVTPALPQGRSSVMRAREVDT